MKFFFKHNILKLLFIEIHKFKNKKSIEQHQYESNE